MPSGATPAPLQIRFRDKQTGNITIDYQVAIGSYAAFGGVWTGNWFEPISSEMPSGNGYGYAEVFDSDSTITRTHTLYHGVGEVIVLIGHSHQAIPYTDGSATGVVIPNAKRVNGGGYIDIGLALQAGEVASANGAPGFTKMVQDYYTKCPANLLTCWVQQGYPSTTIGDWKFSGGAAWSAFASFCSTAGITDARTWHFVMGVNDYNGSLYTITDLNMVKALAYTMVNRNASNMLFLTAIPGQRSTGTDSIANTIRDAHYQFAQQTGCGLTHNQEAIVIFGSVGHFTTPEGTKQDGGLKAYGLLYYHGFVSEPPSLPYFQDAYCATGSTDILLGVVRGPLVLGNGNASGSVKLSIGKINSSVGHTLTALNLVSGVLHGTMSGARVGGEVLSFEFAQGIGPYDLSGAGINQNDSIFNTRGDITFDVSGIGAAPLSTMLSPITVTTTTNSWHNDVVRAGHAYQP